MEKSEATYQCCEEVHGNGMFFITDCCEDVVSREDVIKAIDRHTFDTDDGLCLDEDISIILEEIAPVIPTQKWIPCSERLPDDRKDCIVTFKDGCVDTMYYAPDLYKVDDYDFYAKKGKAGWYDYDSEWGYYSRDDVVAWMPLPEPYKAEMESGVCKGCHYNDGEIHAECVVCDKAEMEGEE